MRALGLDLGGTNIKLVVLHDGELVDRRRPRPESEDGGPAAVLQRMVELGRSVSPVDSIGVALPGLFSEAGVAQLLPNLYGDWTGTTVQAPLAEGFGSPVRLINDGHAFALAESLLGAGRGASNVMCIVCGTGIGGGLILGGSLHLGPSARAGEFGHHTVAADGPTCECGNRGCLELYAGARAIAAAAGAPTFDETLARARSGDGAALAALARAGELIGLAVANVLIFLAPDRVVVGGGVAAAGELLLGPLRASLPTGLAWRRSTSSRSPLPSSGRGRAQSEPRSGAQARRNGRRMTTLAVTLVGGPTAVLEFGGLRWLTDPTLSPPGEYAGLVKTTGPALDPGAIGPIDAVLLSHDHHSDNLDPGGREFLPSAGRVFSTVLGAERLGGNALGLEPWSSSELTGPGGEAVTITAVPAQHGPDGSDAVTGPVIGFVLEAPGRERVYVSGDNASLDVVRTIAERSRPIGIAVLFAGAVQLAHRYDGAYLTLSSDRAAEAAKLLGARVVVPLHYEGWTHFTQGEAELRAAFAGNGIGDRLVVAERGATVTL